MLEKSSLAAMLKGTREEGARSQSRREGRGRTGAPQGCLRAVGRGGEESNRRGRTMGDVSYIQHIKSDNMHETVQSRKIQARLQAGGSSA